MSAIELRAIPGAQPEATIDGFDLYLREKGAQNTADALLFDISAAQVLDAAASIREDVLRDHPADMHAAFLAQHLTEVLSPREYDTTPRLAQTALTDLFATKYGLDLASHTGSGERLYICGGLNRQSANNMVYMNYGTDMGEDPGFFWQLNIDREYGFVNMYCVGLLGSTMLRGSANIIGISGVADALQADMAQFSKA